MNLRVHTPETRQQARQTGALLARTTFIELLCVVSILRTVLTEFLPLTGCSTWWVTALCMLPGLAVYALLRLCMRLTAAATLSDCLRHCLGPFGGWLLSWTLALLLLLDGASSMTALITFFTEGIGTRGTQFTLALLTSAVLLSCLHREGLPRAVYFLRRVMLVAALAAAVFLLRDVRPDGLFPLLGEGTATIRLALCTGWSLAWPLVLLLTLPPIEGRRRTWPLLRIACTCLAVLLFVTLILPHGLLLRPQDLASSLLQPMKYAPPALRTLCHCLLMLLLFLSVAGAAQLATDHLCAPMGQPPGWLPYAVLLLLTATQAFNTRRIWQTLCDIVPWLLLPLLVLSAVCLPIALVRRKRV